MNEWDSLISNSLHQPTAALPYDTSQQLSILFPDRALLEGDACPFDLGNFIASGHCSARNKSSSIHNQVATNWQGSDRGLKQTFENVWLEVNWEEQILDVLLIQWPAGFGNESRFWILANSPDIAERFFTAVCEWSAEVRGEVLIYENGGWAKSSDLFKAIQGSNLDNLVLKGTLKQEIAEDVARFLESREHYERYGVPWKRGILFIGPPGNGKTHCVKALINASRRPCLYVKSFKSAHATDQDNIRQVFQRARGTTPCILVLEDLDSLIDQENRAFFLNELDGFASNAGIVTLATTNHPERLDPSIVDRPSRFDRKYHFELPALSERILYIRQWADNLQQELRLSDAGITEIAELTEEFSFAYLKELFLSSIMQWMNAPEGATCHMDEVMRGQVNSLRQQMATMTEETAGDDMLADDASGRTMAMMMRRYKTMADRRHL